jgi:branched-chain amino acid transport system ATP-binding protein
VNIGGEPALKVDSLVAGYEPAAPIVNAMSLVTGVGEIVVLLGPNGAGKSTLVKAIAGLIPLTAGRVALCGEDITGTAAHRLVRLGLAFVPQTENVFTQLSIEDNLRLAAGVVEPATRPRQIEATYALFPDLAHQRRLPAGRLSGGQRQMLALARAMIVSPKVLLLDEPSAGLSPRLVEVVFGKLGEIRQTGVAIVLVEQNARAALSIGDRAYILAEGRQVYEGPCVGLADDARMAKLYLGARRAPAEPDGPA